MTLLIYHLFADSGIESEYLQQYGKVVRFGLDPMDTNESQPVKCDVLHLPVRKKADLVLAHPPCQRYSTRTPERYREQHPDLIDETREICKEVAEDYVIENVITAPLDYTKSVTLHGFMFGYPFHYRREFETSFPVNKPEKQLGLSSELTIGKGTKEQWKQAKEINNEYERRDIIKTGIPRRYIDHIMKYYLLHRFNG